jgi:hypothetical protein
MNLHDEVLLRGLIIISFTIQTVAALSLAVAIDYLYFKDNRRNKNK